MLRQALQLVTMAGVGHISSFGHNNPKQPIGPLPFAEATTGAVPQSNHGADKLHLAEHLQHAIKVGQRHCAATQLDYCPAGSFNKASVNCSPMVAH